MSEIHRKFLELSENCSETCEQFFEVSKKFLEIPKTLSEMSTKILDISTKFLELSKKIPENSMKFLEIIIGLFAISNYWGNAPGRFFRRLKPVFLTVFGLFPG